MSASARSATLVGLLVGTAVGGFLYLAYCWVIGIANDYRMLKNFEAVASRTLISLMVGGGIIGALFGGATHRRQS